MKKTYFAYNTPIGHITIASDGEAITRIAFGVAILEGDNKPTKLTNDASTQIQEYLAGKRTVFEMPFKAAGTPFQEQVWKATAQIPYGQTRTYGQIAEAAGNPRASRAVGMAVNRNPLPLVVPCHRIIGAQGKPVGYAGGLRIKEFLLNLERVNAGG